MLYIIDFNELEALLVEQPNVLQFLLQTARRHLRRYEVLI
ncbi:protein of unknown function [Moritella yayanosii]|uniref:Uncharacterized protein n=1 Tax=Moritella yayanosii TaxID=69539 RepID=A0A330LKC1_9GAMM|nr:protein of unknown function [Moritella yayanosii]